MTKSPEHQSRVAPKLAKVIFITCITVFIRPLSSRAADPDLPTTGQPLPDLAPFDHLILTFLHDDNIPGASLALARDGKLIYARGYGYADLEKRLPVQPNSLFRIASISKPFTSAAILQLEERGKLHLDDHAFELLDYPPHLEPGQKVDPRLLKITIRQLLHHTAGFDRAASFDPMFRPIEIAKVMGAKPPAEPRQIIEYMMGRPLDFDPGTREAYSNFGYCVLGRVIEKVSGLSYEQYVQRNILHPLGINHMRIGQTLEKGRAENEVRYYPLGDRQSSSVFGDGAKLPVAYGGWYLEAMDSHGGWIASASELACFASSFDDPEHSPILKAATIEQMFSRPKDTGFDKEGKPEAAYYADGWQVRPSEKTLPTIWHAGLLDGTASLLVRRHDGITWAILFNADYSPQHKYLVEILDPLVHPVADQIKHWPQGARFKDE